MATQCSLQDVIRCHLCETPVPSKHCDMCHIHLCEACVSDHLSDNSKEHYIVPFKMRGISPMCQEHSTMSCTELCTQCEVPICSQCVVAGKHNQHRKEDILNLFYSKKELIQKDLHDFEKSIYPKYEEVATNMPMKKAEKQKQTQKLASALNEHEVALHTEIDTIIQKMRSDIDDMDAQQMKAINQEDDLINNTIATIKQIILELKRFLETSDVCVVSKYKSRNEEFSNLLAKFQVIFPTCAPQEINTEKIHQQLKSLSQLATTCPSFEAPENITYTCIQTSYTGIYELYSVTCLNDSELWTCASNNIMRLYNIHEELIKSVQTKSGKFPYDIALTQRGLVYADYGDKSINLVTNTHIQTLIALRGWRPRGVSCTSAGDLLVIMVSDDRKQAKIVRYCYSDSTEKQTIQSDDQGNPLYSPGDFAIKNTCLCENKNLDICVADCVANAVVVVSAAGNLRFRYTESPDAKEKPFGPRGITADSHGHILTADYNNNCIHIVDQDGHFIRYIDNCDLQGPWGLCVDSKDNLFVAEHNTGRVKKIRYYKKTHGVSPQ